MIPLKFLSVVVIVLLIDKYTCDDPVVQLIKPEASVRGHILKTYTGKKYWAFQEIPYSLPPTDDRRFKVPKAHTGWDGVLDATKNTKICMQPMESNPFNLEVTEDCLYLNVYTPVDPSTAPGTELPVLMWFHGGGFQNGSGVFQQWNPQFFIEQDIIVVTFNYRLGPFGFLWAGGSTIPGNLGLRDQKMVYTWVYNNIEQFGGDNYKICLGGQGAGAASVSYQFMQADAKHVLFYCGIMQSGSSISPHYYQPNPTKYAFALGTKLKEGFNSTEPDDLRKLLKKATAEEILKGGRKLQASAAKKPGYYKDLIWLPVVEGFYVDDAFIEKAQLHCWTLGWVRLVHTLIGFTSEERISAAMEDDIMQLALEYDNDTSLLLSPKLGMSNAHRAERGPKMKELYTTENFQNNITGLIRYLSDEVSTPLLKQAYNQSWYSLTWIYQFSYKGELGGMTNIKELEGAGTVGHGEEMKYLWDDGTNSDPSQYSEQDRNMHEMMIKLWSNFIKGRDPTPEKDDDLQRVTWSRISENTLHYLNIDSTLTMEKHTPRYFLRADHIIEKYLKDPIDVF